MIWLLDEVILTDDWHIHQCVCVWMWLCVGPDTENVPPVNNGVLSDVTSKFQLSVRHSCRRRTDVEKTKLLGLLWMQFVSVPVQSGSSHCSDTWGGPPVCTTVWPNDLFLFSYIVLLNDKHFIDWVQVLNPRFWVDKIIHWWRTWVLVIVCKKKLNRNICLHFQLK